MTTSTNLFCIGDPILMARKPCNTTYFIRLGTVIDLTVRMIVLGTKNVSETKVHIRDPHQKTLLSVTHPLSNILNSVMKCICTPGAV